MRNRARRIDYEDQLEAAGIRLSTLGKEYKIPSVINLGSPDNTASLASTLNRKLSSEEEVDIYLYSYLDFCHPLFHDFF